MLLEGVQGRYGKLDREIVGYYLFGMLGCGSPRIRAQTDIFGS